MSNIFVGKITGKSETRIRAWIAALASGDYNQTTGKLRSNISGGYCCLGVICQVNDPDGWKGFAGGYGHEMGSEVARNGYLSDKVARTYNLTKAGQKKLARLNDGGSRFVDIALFLSEQLGAKLAVQAAK